MNSNTIEIFTQLSPWSKSVEFCVVSRDGEQFYKAEPLIMKETSPDLIAEPLFTLSHKAVQSLIDDLWRCGYRPSEGSGSAGQLRATQNHLNDMRKLVFSAESRRDAENGEKVKGI